MSASTPCWIPERLLDDAGIMACQWIDIGDLRFAEPFFESTLARRHRDQPARRTTPLAAVLTEGRAAPAVAPTAFIFHVSRCGSTLLGQLLGLDPQVIVLSEVPVLDEWLRSDLADRDALFAATLRLLGQRRSGNEHALFVKTDCWHIFFADRLRRLYPETPFILLYRSPEAVLVSHRKIRGTQMVPGLIPNAPFTVPFDAALQNLDQHAATVLADHYRAMLEVSSHDPNSLLLSYDEGFPPAFVRMAKWLALALDTAQLQCIQDRCAYHAKRPQDRFDGDTSASLTDVDLSTLHALFEQLEAARQAQLVAAVVNA